MLFPDKSQIYNIMRTLVKTFIKLTIAAIIPILLLYSCKCNDDPIITSFFFSELSPSVAGDINNVDGTIRVKVPENTDVTNLSPTIEVANPSCHTLSPPSNTPRDFSAPVIYEVTNEANDAREYEVSVEFENLVGQMEITWETKAPLPTNLGWLSAVELDGKIYVTGGAVMKEDKTGYMNDKMYVYDPATNTWDDTRAALPVVRMSHSMDVVNGKIYVMGGVPQAIGDALADILVYDPQTDKWQSGGSMPIRRAAFGSCVIDGKIYLVGGELEEPTKNVIDDVSVYDPATGNWTTLAPLPVPRCYLTAEAANGKIYASGGTTESPWAGLDTHAVYDPATDTWTEAAPMVKGLWGLGSCVIDDMIIYAFGTPSIFTAGSADVQIFSASEEKWYEGTRMDFIRLGGSMCEVEGRAYVIGGAVSAYPWLTNTDDMTAGHITF